MKCIELQKSGVNYPLSDTTCTDELGRQTFWNPLPNGNYDFEKYTILYEGSANQTYDNSTLNLQVISLPPGQIHLSAILMASST